MLKLKKNVVEILKANIKPEYLLDTVERIEGVIRSKFIEGFRWLLYKFKFSKYGVCFLISALLI